MVVIKQLGADLKLSGRTLEFTPVKYLIPVAEGQECLKAKKEAARTASQQMKKDLKEDLISSWCARLDLNQHAERHMLLRHTCIPISPLALVKLPYNFSIKCAETSSADCKLTDL